ncbi:hypothetical protein GOP47_0001276, partial [Adiantum capillus-veneris]
MGLKKIIPLRFTVTIAFGSPCPPSPAGCGYHGCGYHVFPCLNTRQLAPDATFPQGPQQMQCSLP